MSARVVIVLAALVLPSAALGQSAPSVGVTLSGRVVEAYPGITPAPDAVQLVHMDGPPMVAPRRIEIRPDRTFAIDGVVPGTYELQVVNSFTTTTVTVGTSDVRDVELVASGQVELLLHTVVDDGSPVPIGAVARVSLGPRGALQRGLEISRTLGVPPGRHWVFAGAPAGLYVRSVTSAGLDLLRAPLDLEPGSAPRVVDIVLTRTKPGDAPALAVFGTVGRPDLEIELLNVTNIGRAFIAGSTVSDERGAFRFEQVEPGMYRISIPPADRVVDYIEVGATDVRVDIPIAPDARVFGIRYVTIDVSGKQTRIPRPVFATFVAERGGTRTRIPFEFIGGWGALPPGTYQLTVEGLAPGYSVRAFAAGSVNLLEQPFVVPADRPAETVRLELNYRSSD